jgi:hypothetical protein
MFGDICSWKRIEAHTDSLELSPLQKSAKMFTRNAFACEVAGTRDSLPLNKSNNLLSGG